MRLLRSKSLWFTIAGTVVLAALVAALVVGLGVPERYVVETYELGRAPAGRTYQVPPFKPESNLLLFASGGGREAGVHYYVLGSDAGGRDLLGLLARGAVPSLELVAAALVGRFLVGIAAGIAMGLGVGFVSTLSRSMGRWFAGFPYLAFAIIVIQTLSTHNRFGAFAVAMAAAGCRRGVAGARVRALRLGFEDAQPVPAEVYCRRRSSSRSPAAWACSGACGPRTVTISSVNPAFLSISAAARVASSSPVKRTPQERRIEAGSRPASSQR